MCGRYYIKSIRTTTTSIFYHIVFFARFCLFVYGIFIEFIVRTHSCYLDRVQTRKDVIHVNSIMVISDKYYRKKLSLLNYDPKYSQNMSIMIYDDESDYSD